VAVAERPRVALGLGAEPAAVAAAVPILASGVVEALEWSFDTCWRPLAPVADLLDHYGRADVLYGHGVTGSLFSGRWTARQEAWLACLADEVRARRYRHVTEHEGFVTAGDRTDGAPLPVPLTPGVVRVGVERLQRLRDVAGVVVGLENLAFAFSDRDVDQQGDLLDAVLAPVDGILLLDLHNLWCRAVNFGRDPVRLLERLPLSRAREIHLSGGSWDDGFRRDTHDGPVPDDVFALLPEALARCPQVEVVVVERVGPSLGTDVARSELARDVARVAEVVGA
jgi:uncharacterized protein (UPF0276 family)